MCRPASSHASHDGHLECHAIATAADLQTDHARPKGLKQDLGIGRVKAEVRDNQRIRMVAAVNRCQRAGAGTSK